MGSDLPVMGLRGERFDLPVTWDPDKLMVAIISIRPDVIHARPSVLRAICSRDTSNDLCKLRIRTAIVVGEQCAEQARSQIEQHLGCPIVNFYSSTECGRIATSCPHCTQFHINAEAIAVEVLKQARICGPVRRSWIDHSHTFVQLCDAVDPLRP